MEDRVSHCPHCGCAYEPTGLTEKQAALLRFVVDFHEQYGRFPPYSAIMHELGYSTQATVSEHVHNLVAKGWLSVRTDGNKRARSIIAARAPATA